MEATAIGNIAMQCISSGEIGSIAEAREAVRRSFDVREYEPSAADAPMWDEAYGRFQDLLK